MDPTRLYQILTAGGMAFIASTYERGRFGQKPLTDDEAERLDAAWSSARGSLLRRALRLKPQRR